LAIEYILGVSTFLTSVVAGVLGFGGGMLLISILPFYLAPALIIPIHGIAQLASNSSRMVFSWRDVSWPLLPKFFIGSILGVITFGFLLVNISNAYIPIAIGLYIILNLWSPHFARFISHYENYYLIGFLQTGLGLVVGAPGPIALSVLTKDLRCKNAIIATQSLFMTITHIAKIPVYGVIGVALIDHVSVIVFMVAGAIAGSLVGTKLRKMTNNDKLILFIKCALSLLAIKMIITAVALIGT
jgi:uncharacterized membrane protein YfcA